MTPSPQPLPHRTTRTSAAEELLALLARQKFMVTQLAALARKQGEHVREGDGERLLDLLGSRQQLIDRVLAAQQEVSALTRSIEGDAAALDTVQRGQAAAIVEEIKAALSEVMQQDDADRAAIEAARQDSRAELRTIDQARQARQAYSSPAAGSAGSGAAGPHPGARFADRKG